MRVKLTRLFAVALLMMISMGADAKIRVDIGNFEGGTIKEKSQTDPDEKGLVTVTITVTPDKGYTISQNDIVVVSTYSPSGPAGTRNDPQIAGTIDLLGKDPEDLGDPRDYTFIVASSLGAWVKEAKFAPSSKGPNRSLTKITSLSDITEANGTYYYDADIDASGFSTISSFSGTLTATANADGNFPVITGLKCPLFTTATGATISNIMFKSIAVSGSGPVGAVCGTANGTTRIYNCGILPTTNDHPKGTTRSTVTSTDNDCGSLVGYLDGYARVINCFSYADVSASSNAGGLVGNNTTATMQGNSQTNFNNNVKTMVVNCMFYGDIVKGSPKRPVYGGTAIVNNDKDKVNNYNYYCEEEASFDNDYTGITDYNFSWPVAKKHLTRFEVYRNILNSNRRLCTWWVNGSYNTCPTDADVESVGIAKWVLDRTIAPYPILKKWGKYYSTFDIDPDNVWNPKTKTNIARSIANPWEGKSETNKLSVTIKGGSNNSSADDVTIDITITDMDTLNYDYCAKKIQLPYYNEIFGNPNGDTWAAKYGNNYTSKVVTGWKVIDTDKDGSNSFSPDWESGYNFADRDCTEKDIYSSTNPRVFAQGGYYYVPNGVTKITIEAYWGDAVYLCNSNRRLDKMNNGTSEFYDSGKLPEKVGGVSTNPAVKTSLNDAIGALKTINDENSPGNTVYDQAMVLVGNYQDYSCHTYLTLTNGTYDTAAKPFTIMSADFDFDNEPDFCFQAGMNGSTRPKFQPIRFDFLMVPDITMAIRTLDLKYYGIRNICPQGHYEVTETSYMYVTQFEYEERSDAQKHEAPMILNGGEFMQIVSTHSFNQASANATATKRAEKTSYFLMGGKLYMKAFTPGTHVIQRNSTRHCAVNAIGGEFPEFYLSGMFRSDFYNMTDNPHAYLDGGWFGMVAGAGMESVGAKGETDGGNVTFKINHSRIHEFYGGGINATRPVTGNIDVTIDNSIVHKYCGGPKLGDMSSSKTITTTATGTTFDQFFGGGNGGTNMLRENKCDGWDKTAPSKTDHSFWDRNNNYDSKANNGGNFDAFSPFYFESNKGYQVEFEFELLPIPSGLTTTVPRTYYYYASFSKTMVAPITNIITDCTFNGNFYGGGNLGSVGGDVTSTLKGNTVVHGSAFGAGFSASIPSFPVHDKSLVNYAYRDFAGFIHDGSLDYKKYTTAVGNHAVGDTIYYQWINVIPEEWGVSPSTSNPTFEYPVNSGNWYCYTSETLEKLGAVSGSTTLNILEGTIVEGSVYGGGDESNVIGNTNVNICAVQDKNDATKYNPVAAGGSFLIEGNVFGGGRGMADNFQCDKAMIGELNDGDAHPDGGTTVNIFNGTVQGNVYGGGEVGRVEKNTVVTIGTGDGVASGTLTSAPVIEGSVFGAGAGVNTHGYSALVRGNSTVTVQGNAKVKNSVYGGGEIASVGKYNINDAGMPVSLANQNRGYCTVNVKGYAEIGPDTPMEMKTATGYPDDAGHVFGAGRGVLPYEGVEGGTDGEPWRMKPGDIKQIFVVGKYKYEEGKENPNPKIAYLRYIETLALATQSYVTISGNALVKGSVYGGSMNGHVQHHTQVTITGGQIGCSKGTTGRLSNDVWDDEHYEIPEGTNLECASWDYAPPYASFDIYDYVDATVDNPVPKPATDGHTFFGNVFGGGSGYYPYSINPDLTDEMIDLGYSDGLWHRDAGSVGGNSVVNITGGHILSSVYGGNEQTDVGTYVKDSNGDNTIEVDPNAGNVGKCTVNISGGTIGVPRTPEQINAHPVICNVFGAGKGDKRVNFNKWTNVVNTEVNISGTARIYGSVFGGGEDGHVIEDAKTNIGGSFTMTVNDEETEVSVSNDVLIGTTGTSGADGNVFGGGRGSVTALTAGVVGGNINLDIHGGTILGSVFGGGRLASVGTFFADPNAANYGDLQGDAGDTDHGNIVVNITKGTIGATDANGDLMTSKFTIGDVFGASKGSDDPSVDPRFGMVRNTTINITGGTINRSVFGGGEIGKVRENTTVNIGTKKTE